MSIAYSGSPEPSYLEYEPARPNPKNSLVLRAVADAGQDSPIVGITSVADAAQNVTIHCFGSGEPEFSKIVSVPPDGTILTPACNGARGDPLSISGTSESPQNPGASQAAKGISLTTDAPPGSFAAVGYAPRDGGGGTYLTAMQFSDPKSAKTSTTIFPGLPVGSATLLAGGYYVPELSVANFSTSPAHITVKYSRATGGTPDVRTVETLVVPAGGSATADLQGLQGDPDLQNSFEVVSDQPPGEVLDKLSSASKTGIRWVELPGKDAQNPHNAGNHPWTVADGTDSTILIFNETSAAETFTVRVASGAIVWTKKYSLAPLETRAIDINKLLQDQVKDDNGRILSRNLTSGIANWSEARQFGGTGRLLQSNPAEYSAQSFSCGEWVVIIGGDFSPDTTSELVGETSYLGTLYAQMGLTEDPGCFGEYLGDSQNYTYVWWSENTSIANVSAYGTSSDPEVKGLAPGDAQIDGDVSDQYGCAYLTGVEETVMGDQTPVITGISPSAWPAGSTTAVTITGEYFGTNAPTLSLSDSSIGYTLSSHNDRQIVANISVPTGTPVEDVQVTVTNNGYGGNSFANGQTGNSPSSGPVSATVQAAPSGPEVTIIGWVDGQASDIVTTIQNGPSTAALQSSLNGGFFSCSNQLYQWWSSSRTNLNTAQDAAYANAWLLQKSANPPPPPNTINPATELQSGEWRLFNDFGGGKSTAAIGTTPFPCLGGTTTWFDPNGQSSQYLGYSGTTQAGRTYLLSEGRVGTAGQKINSTINNNTTPWVWSVIELDPSGNPTWPYLSMFPTYDIYINGQWVDEIHQGNAQTFIGQGAGYQLSPSQIQ